MRAARKAPAGFLPNGKSAKKAGGINIDYAISMGVFRQKCLKRRMDIA
jgi:hypothetical protein